MQGLKRKIVYIALYEAIAIAFATLGLSLLSGHDMVHSGALAVTTSAIAIVWNLVYNTLFEYWESRQRERGRSVLRRVLHAAGFETGLVMLLVPTIAWWLEITVLHAFALNLGLMVFFLGYTFVFNWGFDRIFGLPTSALGPQAEAQAG